MSVSLNKATQIFENLKEKASLEDMLMQLRSSDIENSDKQPANEYSHQNFAERVSFINDKCNVDLAVLPANNESIDPAILQGSIENFIGMTQVPTGLVGPMRVNGSEAKGDYYLPLATTEGALVASYHRGAKATLLSGGISTVCLTEGVRRSPLFGFKSIEEGLRFLIWVTKIKDEFYNVVNQKTKHGKLNDVQLNIEGNHVVLTFEYLTGDASGQNMVTICTDAICQYLVANTPIHPQYWYIEGNYSGDKKASALSFTTVRGKKVSSECIVPGAILNSILKSNAHNIAQYWRASTVSVIQTGSIGAQGHFANGLW